MRVVSFIKKIIFCSIFVVLLIASIINVHTVYAGSLAFYNYTTGQNVNYTGKQVIYTLNNRTIELSHPGIIIDGTALADYEELFVRELGLKVEHTGDTLIFSDGTTELILIMGSNITWLNGKIDITNVAPVKLKFGDETKYYVPTRYVAENFGFSYVWISDISTVKITKNLSFTDHAETFSYNGTMYRVKYQENTVFTDMPGILYHGNVMVPAKQIFEAAGCIYEEYGTQIKITKNQLTLSLVLNDKTAYVNEKKIIANSVPVRITDNSTGKTAIYVSIDFVTDILGFERTYSSAECCYNIQDSVFTGCIDLYPDLLNGFWKTSFETVTEEQVPQKYYFEWVAPESTQYAKNLSKIVAYSVDNADVVELFGVSKENITCFSDNGMLVFELKDVTTGLDANFYSDFEAPHLNYALLTPLKTNIKLIIMMAADNHWTMIEKANSVQIYFSAEDIDVNVQSIQTPAYPNDVILVPLSGNVINSDITDVDKYSEHKFIINLIGNHTDYINIFDIINPYYGVEISDISYDAAENQTQITFTTNSICGYEYTINQGYLCIKIGKPKDFHSKIIILDAGHGGIDPGAIKKGYYEKNINFTILNQYTKALFDNSDVKVYFTRETDVKIDLYERAALAAEIGADMFISLHMNANNSSSANGTEVYYSTANNAVTENGLNSYQLAKTLAKNISTAIGTKNRGASKSEFVVVKYNTVPAVLIELGFMTNTNDLKKLTSTEYQQKTAKAIYETVLEIYSSYFLR